MFAKFRTHNEKRRGHTIKMIVLKMTDAINSGGQGYEAQQNKCD